MTYRRHVVKARVVGGAIVLLSTAAALGLNGSSAAVSRPVHRAATLTAVPLLKFNPSEHFASAPNTNQCEQMLGYACYSPLQLETAYDMKPLYASGDTGKGETIVIVDSFGSPTIRRDLATFDKTYGLPNPKLTILQPAGKVPAWNPKSSAMGGWAAEASLDVEYSHAMAPGANIVLVETPVNETEGIAGLPQMMSAELAVMNPKSKYYEDPSVISQSFGATESTFATAQQIIGLSQTYQVAQADDVTVLASTGDDGSTEPVNAAGTKYSTTPAINWPASDPLVTAVGGTQLHLNLAGQRLLPDNAWNDTNFLGSPAAGGGGRSIIFNRPTYQNGVKAVAGVHRVIPDISLSAAVDGGAVVYLSFPGSQKGYYPIGGTSEASPLFAGVVAVTDQVLGRHIGFLNPYLYSLAAKATLKHDVGIEGITTGDNTVSFLQGGTDVTVPGWVATPGYNLVTGLGTIDGAKLVAALKTVAPVPSTTSGG
ncbi:MAG: S53 family peptidase [Acidimicrobiales bacterium]|jgi:subtilase family serine protease